MQRVAVKDTRPIARGVASIKTYDAGYGKLRAPDERGIADAAALILAGRAVAVPTETVYGFAADATNADAVAGIYAAKGRPSFNPLIVHVRNRAMAEGIATFSDVARRLADAFWPGPLTMVLPLRDDSAIAALVTAGLPTVALRMPDHPVMHALIDAAGRPLAAPSANRSGSVSPTTAQHVLNSLGDRVEMVLDGGHCRAGIESTIIRPGDDAITLLRPGPIIPDDLQAATGLPIIMAASGAIEAPGQLASHYAPGKPVTLDCTDPPADSFHIRFGRDGGDFTLSPSGDLVEAAARLFDALHAGATDPRPHIAVDPIPHHGLGIAINDRLSRAAAPI